MGNKMATAASIAAAICLSNNYPFDRTDLSGSFFLGCAMHRT